MTIISFILFTVFTILGGFHFYWLAGGKWGISQVVPVKSNENVNFQIPKFATLLVALMLSCFASLYLIESGVFTYELPKWAKTYVLWFIPSIFLLRAVGDFNYFGLFRKIKGTKFSKSDTLIFTPLCIVIGLLGLLVQMIG